jgi:hypothetical protein
MAWASAVVGTATVTVTSSLTAVFIRFLKAIGSVGAGGAVAHPCKTRTAKERAKNLQSVFELERFINGASLRMQFPLKSTDKHFFAG